MEKNDKPLLLWVMEIGGYPDFSSLYHALGFEVVKVQSVRKALQALKTANPQVVVAEFNYAPTYGARISPVEPLLARLQSHHPMAKLILFTETEVQHHLGALKQQYGELDVLTFPIKVEDLNRRIKPN